MLFLFFTHGRAYITALQSSFKLKDDSDVTQFLV